ncbi:MAG: RdgB/HAM1 family non-canonical purine NTP pyrophosphatase [Endomicrobium sp.]|jgi:XTP/dITP diphosphohydrolase|nr:RdgB/HAM1 family non-canonical purine NTP pyrophosphatase [Endomicrobium sp.]
MITEIILATTNKYKIIEIKAILKNINIKLIPMICFPKYPYIIEDGKTIKENAAKKAIAAAIFFKKLALADDSGLEVDYLKGAPGIYSKRYAGKGCTCNDNNRKLLSSLKGVPLTKRTATLKTIIAIANPNKDVFFAYGEIFGTIHTEIIGDNGFGYDSVFYIQKYKKTLSELSHELKNSISHRAKALNKITNIIKKHDTGK